MSHAHGRRARIVASLAAAAMAATASTATAALTTDDLAGGSPTAIQLAQSLAGPGVTVSNATYAGAPAAAGTFAGGGGIVGFDDGVILGSGAVASVVGPNTSPSATTVNGTPGDDQDLLRLFGGPLGDAAVLAFDFVPSSSVLTFNYVFGSDGYNEYVGNTNPEFRVADVFAFVVNGQNCALVPGTSEAVSIDTINGGNPFGTTDPTLGVLARHPELYRNNDYTRNGSPIDTQMDGLTTVLTCRAAVTPGQTNRIKLAIADRDPDLSVDSNVFLQRASFNAPPPVTPPAPPVAPPDRDADGIPDADDTSDASVAPKLAETVIARVVSGQVFVRRPAGSGSRSAVRAAQTGTPRGYVPLKGAEVLPVGTIVHATRGRLALTSFASRVNGRTRTQRAEFFRGVFQIRQKRARPATTDIVLRSTDFAKACGSAARAAKAAGAFDVFAAQAKRRSKKVVRRLWGNGKGRFRTIGRHSAATVRGTIWLTEERCDGTLTRVTRGVVSVRNLNTRRTVTVRAGRSYLARAVRATVRTRRP